MSLKFTRFMIDESMTLKTQVKLLEKTVSKSIGILFKTSRFVKSNYIQNRSRCKICRNTGKTGQREPVSGIFYTVFILL